MKEILITSSVLILALLLLRWLFRNAISCRVRYALWALVLLRLLVPVTLPALDFSILSAAGPVENAVSRQLGAVSVYYDPVAQMDFYMSAPQTPDRDTPVLAVGDSGSHGVRDWGIADGHAVFSESQAQYVWYAEEVSLRQVLVLIWCAGIAVMACWLLVTNVRFGRMLKKTRVAYPVADCNYAVYLVERGLCSPCLFGLVRPAIYLTPAAIKDEDTLRHVIAHETAHGRHLDLLWSFLRNVCLVVYWFDPLVWIAAKVSRTDCELACDEGAMKHLDEEERLAYGQTLLSLIPVRRSWTPLLSATTMTSDKKRLKDRVVRIAENRKTVITALVAVIIAAAVLCILTFTGAKEEDSVPENPPTMDEILPEKPEDPVEEAPEQPEEPVLPPLTGEELAFFNNSFFGDVVKDGVIQVNIRCQFLTSSYESPAQIDLFELLYNGLGGGYTLSPEEMELAGSEACPTNKLPVEAINEVLLTYTGLTLEETNQLGLDRFQYLEEYDSYYHTHGDTNWPGSPTMYFGSRDGDRIYLYHQLTYGWSESGWMCLTLLDKGDGNYWFVSNLPCDAPNIQLVLPEGAPALTIPLNQLEPVEMQRVELKPASNDCAERGGGYTFSDLDMRFRAYQSHDGNLYAAIVHEEAWVAGQGMVQWEVERFFTYPQGMELDDCDMMLFHLFGMPVILVQYSGQYPNGTYGTCHDIFGLDSSTGDLYFLTTYYGDTPRQMDLNGDGINELVGAGSSSAQVLFRKNDDIYEIDIGPLLEAAWPELEFWAGYWEESYRAVIAYCTASMPQWGEGAYASCVRQIYFDGESLLVYPQIYETIGHFAENVPSDTCPEIVYEAAKKHAKAAYEASRNGEDGMMRDQGFDDWRVTSLRFVHSFQEYGLQLEVYEADYAFHASDPGAVVLAGGTSIGEDGWVSGFYREQSPYLLFQVHEDGSRTQLESLMPLLTSPGSAAYDGSLYASLLKNGLVQPADLTGEHQLMMLLSLRNEYLNVLGESDSVQWQGAVQNLVQYCQNAGNEEPLEDLKETIYWLVPSAWTEAGHGVYDYIQSLLVQ